jgi:Glucose / Sorbosone dehydrogenase
MVYRRVNYVSTVISHIIRGVGRLLACVLAAGSVLVATSPGDVVLELRDYVEFPITGRVDGKGQTDGMLARINSLREEPGGATRFFVNDLNGPLYIVDKASRKLTTYLDFNGRDGHHGLFRKLAYEAGYANGLNSLQFDPDYRTNGRFYTVHIEDPALPGSAVPDNAQFPALDVSGYTTTAPARTPGGIQREGVLVEWTDRNPSNTTFEGTSRELLRVQLNTRIHTLADLQFNPAARRGDSEWRVLYIGSGDGGSGESRLAIRMNPQRLDTLVGKVLRIVPDLAEHTTTSSVSDNGRYRIPNDNPFVNVEGARKEIWAYGFRNPARLHFAIDPANAANNRLIADSIGLGTWETVNIVHKGGNYGYSRREGNEMLQPDNRTAKLPDDDRIPVQVTDTVTQGAVTPMYPVIQYGHVPGGGDAIGSGFLYRGTRLPALVGKYVFTDISTGHVWYADYGEMLAADDGKPDTMAVKHEIRLRWNDPHGAPDGGSRLYDTMFPIAEAAYHFRGGKSEHLPGIALVSGNGRADAHVAVDGAGELYIFTKTDGVLRVVTALTSGS